MTQIKDIATTKTTAEDGDFLIMQNPITGETYKITKADLLAGLSGGSGSGSGSTGDPSFSKVVLLCLFNGNVGTTSLSDSSSLNNSVVAYGNTQISADGKFGQCVTFDGTEDYILIPDHPKFNFGLSDFTIEVWIYPTSFGNQYGQTIISHHVFSLSIPDYGWLFFLTPSGNLRFYTANSSGSVNLQETAIRTLNSWQYVAIKRSLGIYSIWADGVQVATDSAHSSFDDSFSGINIKIGTQEVYGSGYATYGDSRVGFKGKIDEIRITNNIARDLSIVPVLPFPNS